MSNFLQTLTISIISPSVLGLIIAYVFKSGSFYEKFMNALAAITRLEEKIETLSNKIHHMDKRLTMVENKVSEISKRLSTVEKRLSGFGKRISIVENKMIGLASTTNYGATKSPMQLKDEFVPFIFDTGMDKELEKKKPELLKWLKSLNPATGIDAQEAIYNLAMSEEVEKYISKEAFNKYKQNLYEKGKTKTDAYGILGVYLFGILIPELNLDHSSDNTES